MPFGILIPAYQPRKELVDVVRALTASEAAAIVIVNDGSSPASAPYFEAIRELPRVQIVRHAVNLGKGAALKTGMNHLLCHFPELDGVVTADADGQHAPEDILRVGRALVENQGSLVLGARRFGDGTPFRSRFGNRITRGAMRMLVGQALTDTQTGLRGIPRPFMGLLLRLASTGYEFELDMLIAAKHRGIRIHELPIRTIYLDGNSSSHFNPLLDSMRIYFVLLRYSAASALTALLDNLVFALAFYKGGAALAAAQLLARMVAVVFNYTVTRRMVFLSEEEHSRVLPRYLSLVAVSGALSYALITFLHESFGVEIYVAKPAAETLLFFANFAIQRDFVYSRKSAPAGATSLDA